MIVFQEVEGGCVFVCVCVCVCVCVYVRGVGKWTGVMLGFW